MNSYQRYIAQLILRDRILTSDGLAFENLFSSIMEKSNSNFMQVRPYGNVGDRKNDGFDKITGEYYQVFAPLDIHNPATITAAVSKLEDDFKGLYDYWNDTYPIKKYNFVVNDKCNGAPPQLHIKVGELKKEYPNVEFNIFTVAKLEDVLLGLGDAALFSVVGYIPDLATQLDYSALTEVIEHLMNMQDSSICENLLVVPDFEEKITFNRLSNRVATMLRNASYQVGGLEEYFRCHSEFTKSEVQRKIVECYVNATKVIDNSLDNYSDLVFMKVLDDIYPNGSVSIRSAILVLMAYYFESCDIFEKPEEETAV